MKKINQLKAGVFLSYVSLGIGTIIPLLYTPVMLSILGQSEYGLYSLSNSVISYLSLFTLGFGGAILRYLMKYFSSGDKIMFERVAGLFIALYSIIAGIVLLVGFSLTFFTGAFFAKGLSSQEIQRMNVLLFIMTISTAISFISSVFSSLVSCYERYIFKKLLVLISSITSPILNIVILYAGFGSVGMALVSLLLQIITLAIYIFYCSHILDIHPRFKKLPVFLLKEMFTFTLFVFISSIADLLYWATDKVLIGATLGSIAVGIYNIGSTFQGILQNMSGAISNVFAPRVNSLVFLHKPIKEVSELFIRIGRIQYLIVSLVLSGFIAFGQPFIRLWAGDGYQDAYPIALLTMIPMAIPLIQNIAFTTIVAQNKHQFRSILYVVLAIANVIGTYILLPVMGIVGAALCTCIVFVIGHGIIMNWFYFKKIGLDIPHFWYNIFKMSIVPALLVCICFLLKNFGLNVNKPWPFLFGVAIYALSFCALSWLFTMNTYEKDLIKGLLRPLLRKRGNLT